MEALILRFDAPLMSFGGVVIDQHGPTDRFPAQSLLTGLFGNALGYDHRDAELLESLQQRLEWAARWDVTPEPLLDYQTADLGQDKMMNPGWTTRGAPEHRAGGAAARLGTHQRYRQYWANGVMTVAATLQAGSEPTLASLRTALDRPARPLFIGRKTCLPCAPLLVGAMEARDVLHALCRIPLHPRAVQALGSPPYLLEACWPVQLGPERAVRTVPVYDQRDWRKGIAAGRRMRLEGTITCQEGS